MFSFITDYHSIKEKIIIVHIVMFMNKFFKAANLLSTTLLYINDIIGRMLSTLYINNKIYFFINVQKQFKFKKYNFTYKMVCKYLIPKIFICYYYNLSTP